MKSKNLEVFSYLCVLFFVSVWIIYSQNFNTNSDAAVYVKQAHFFAVGDNETALKIYNWPFYAYLISRVSLLFGVSYTYSSQIINVISFLFATFLFFKVLIQIAPNSDKAVLSGFLVILTSIPLLDDYMCMGLRDNGAWAGFMGGVLYYLRCSNEDGIKNNFFCHLNFFLGGLFRPELLAFNIVLPLRDIYYKKRDMLEFKYILRKLHFIGVLLTFSVIYLSYKINDNGFSFIESTKLSEFSTRPKLLLASIAKPLPINVSNYELNKIYQGHSLAFKYIFFTYLIIYKWITGLKFFHFGLAFFAVKTRLVRSIFSDKLAFLFFISLIIPATSLFINFFLSGRYLVFNWWVVYVYSAIGLSYFFYSFDFSNWKIFLWRKLLLLSVIFGFILVVLIDTSYHHKEMLDAANWVKLNGKLTNGVYSNDRRLDVLMGNFLKKELTISDAKTQKFKLILLRGCHDDFLLVGYHLVKSFHGEKPSDLINIYEID